MDKPFIKWLLGLLDNSPSGMSMRKVLAVWIMFLVTRLHNKYISIQLVKESEDWNFGETLLYADYIMIGLLIGFIVFQDVMKLFRGKSDPQEPEKKEPDAPAN